MPMDDGRRRTTTTDESALENSAAIRLAELKIDMFATINCQMPLCFSQSFFSPPICVSTITRERLNRLS